MDYLFGLFIYYLGGKPLHGTRASLSITYNYVTIFGSNHYLLLG